MLLKVGFVMMAFAAMLAGVVVAVVSTEEPARSAAVKSAREPVTEPLKRTDPQIQPRREEAVPISRSQKPEPAPELKPEQASEPATSPGRQPVLKPVQKPKSQPEPQPAPQPPPDPQSEPRPEPPPEPKPVVEEPPEPTNEEIASAHRPRHYDLPDGAVLGLTVPAIGIHDVPVFDSVGASALKYGVGHHPETSMPWTDAPQRNVYLAGHRLGFPGTDSHLIFYRLNDLGEGDEILLRGRDGKRYRYRVTETFKATPKDSWVMGQVRDSDMVTLQTCTGPDWERRLIVRADRI